MRNLSALTADKFASPLLLSLLLAQTTCGSEMSKPIIAVIGATGSQGGSAAKALIKNGKFAVRGLTRDPNSAKSKAAAVSLGRGACLLWRSATAAYCCL